MTNAFCLWSRLGTLAILILSRGWLSACILGLALARVCSWFKLGGPLGLQLLRRRLCAACGDEALLLAYVLGSLNLFRCQTSYVIVGCCRWMVGGLWLVAAWVFYSGLRSSWELIRRMLSLRYAWLVLASCWCTAGAFSPCLKGLRLLLGLLARCLRSYHEIVAARLCRYCARRSCAVIFEALRLTGCYLCWLVGSPVKVGLMDVNHVGSSSSANYKANQSLHQLLNTTKRAYSSIMTMTDRKKCNHVQTNLSVSLLALDLNANYA